MSAFVCVYWYSASATKFYSVLCNVRLVLLLLFADVGVSCLMQLRIQKIVFAVCPDF